MAKPDLILLHAPSVYDFRKMPIMYGPVSDVIPSGPIFEMYPIGFATIAEYLERSGLSVRIINIAVRMMKSPRFDVEKLIRSLDAQAFGIDLHWLPHAHGSLEIAKIIKKYHPHTPVIFGGFSATYFHEELIRYPQVDFVVRGDSTEEPLRLLIECIKNGGNPEVIPNLTWKDLAGNTRMNPITCVPDNINYISLDYGHIMRSVVKYQDLIGHIPFENWLKYPITAALTCRGCTKNCVTCGGSATTFRKIFRRNRAAFRDPELLAQDIESIQRHLKGPIFVVGDVRQAGDDYAHKFLSELKKRRITNRVAFEFFTPPPEDFLASLKEALPHYSVEISMESHDEEVRRAIGKIYSNEAVEASIKYALNNGCERFDLYFMTGLPKQTAQSVLDTVEYCDQLYGKLDGDKRLLLFISPMAPFLDPGSQIFENPDSYGYSLSCKTLEEHRQALTRPSWKYILNYETQWMTRNEQVESTYQAALGLNRLKAEYGAVDFKTAQETEVRILRAQEVIKKIDDIVSIEDEVVRERRLRELKGEELVSVSTVCEKRELEWPTQIFNFRALNIIRTLSVPKFARANPSSHAKNK
ncbi:MAG: TIGR04190 family B12-binding domain/radical SAM domain protein [Actinomycetota bacterium]